MKTNTTRAQWSQNVTEQYRKQYMKCCDAVAEHVRKTLDVALRERGINYTTSARGKKPESLRRKLLKRGGGARPTIDELLPLVGTESDKSRIKDLAGARVSLYFPSDWVHVEAAIFAVFRNVTVKEHPETARDPRLERKRFEGYVARHYYVDGKGKNRKWRVELQVASALTHAWMEVQHDLVYKPRRKRLDAQELATLDGLNGITTAGEVLLDGLKVGLLDRGVLKAPRIDQGGVAKSALSRSENEYVAIGQNLFGLLVDDGGSDNATRFQDALIRRLVNQNRFTTTIIVADPGNKDQMSNLEYGFPLFRRHLWKSVAALKKLRARADKAGIGTRLKVGTSKTVALTSIFLSDRAHAGGVAYVRHTLLGSRPQERPTVIIKKSKHKVRFAELDREATRCVETLKSF